MNSYLILLLFVTTTHTAINTTKYYYQILPTTTYINVNGTYFTQASSQACYADCQSCQIKTLVCQQCFAPYYIKQPQGTCQFSSNYTQQSSSNEQRQGAGFFIAGQSWSNYKVTNCSAQNINPQFTANLVAIQPVNNSQVLQYNRTISIHSFIVVTFLLVKSNWTNNSSLTFSFRNQAGVKIIDDIKQTYLPNVPKQSLCNPAAIDQRFAISLRIQDTNSTSISISMISTDGQFSLATWAVLSGVCDSTCSSCSYSTDPKACLGCNYFLRQVSDGSCSQCPVGFKLSLNNNFSFCQKCAIQYQSCSTTQTTCYYGQLNITVSNDCQVNSQGSFYDQLYQINQQIFAGSLFTVDGSPSPSLYTPCGNQPLSSYTYVGPAQMYQPITRIFATLRQHISFSISFNVFVVDMKTASQDMKFEIYINNNLYDVRYLTVVGMSNLCGGSGLQSFMTFPPTQFYQNSQTQNVNLTIVANAPWGIRNLRLVFEVCDQSCLKCGPNGCIECMGILQIKNGKCSDCPLGFGKNLSVVNQDNYDSLCIACPLNCLNCTISNKTVTCLLCSAPFFLFQNACQKKTNIGEDLSASNLTGLSNSACSINILSSNPSFKPTTFSLSQNTITTTIITNQPHYKYLIEFYLLRVGQWSVDDRIEIYFNDLLMLTKNYSYFGNKICNKGNNSSKNDFLSFQSVQYTDSNSSLTLSFELVTVNSTKRTFGVSNIKVYPVGCQSCLTYPFNYKIQYSYDKGLNVVATFSRTYKNTNITLFKQIFQLILNGNQLDYDIKSNNSVSYNLIAYPTKDTTMGNLTLKCLYPQLVATDINDPVNTQPFFARLLAANYSSSKKVDNNQSDTIITRFTPVQKPDDVSGVRTFFQVVSRTIIYIGFASFFFGLQTVCTHFMHNLQKIWLHIFLASLTAPALLRYALSGFQQVQNQNIAVNPTTWQKGLPLELYYTSPVYFYSYNTDVNFFRNIYNVGVAFAVFIVFLIIMHFVTKKCITRQMTQNNLFLRHMKITFHRRPFFYFNSVVFYQYLTLMLACFLQFTSLNNKTDQGSFSGITAAATVITFILGTIYPIFHFLWLRHKQNTIGRDKTREYANRYHQIFFRFVNKNIWQGKQITYAQRFYNVCRFGELWLFALFATALYQNPQAQLYLMIIIFASHMFIILFTGLSRNLFFKVMKSLQLALFVGLEIIMLVCQTDNATLTARSYNTLGNVAITLIFFIIFISLIRSIYNTWLLYRQYSYMRIGQQQKSRLKQGEVMRRDEYFNSENGEQNFQIQIAGTERQ